MRTSVKWLSTATLVAVAALVGAPTAQAQVPIRSGVTYRQSPLFSVNPYLARDAYNLAFAGRHVTSYAERPRTFAALLADEPQLAALLPPGFEDDLARAAAAKLEPVLDDVLPAGAEDAQRKWIRSEIAAAVPATAALLRWELGRLLGGDAPLPALLERWTLAQPWRHRARQWAKLALHPLPSPVPLSLVRGAALARRSTPRALAHAAGALAYLALGEDAPPAGAARLLPLADLQLSTAADERAAVIAFWRWCVRND